jgi:hypothetical protein
MKILVPQKVEISLATKWLFVRYVVHMAASIKGTAFWDMALCSHAEENRRFRDAYCFHHQDNDDRPRNRHDNRGTAHLWNVGLILLEGCVLQATVLWSSTLLPGNIKEHEDSVCHNVTNPTTDSTATAISVGSHRERTQYERGLTEHWTLSAVTQCVMKCLWTDLLVFQTD